MREILKGFEMKITIIGAGYVGLTTAALLANAGYETYLIESHFLDRLETIKSGRSWFFETGLDPLVARGIKSGKLMPVNTFDCLTETDIAFSCMGTPDNPDGSSNLTYVFSVAEQVARLMPNGSVFVQKSTVPVGTGDAIKLAFTDVNKDIAYVSNPEFLRESTAIADTLWFDRVVVGSDNPVAAEKVASLYKAIESQRNAIAAISGVTPSATQAKLSGEYIATSQNSAELIKVTANAFLALKISFANSIAKLADATGADIKEVMDAVGADPRIGRSFLNAGRGYGGGCFPKDVSGLIASAQANGAEMNIMHEAANVNAGMPSYIAEKIKDASEGILEGKKIAVLGLAFKAGTSDARRSPAIDFANILERFGGTVRAYDPAANEEAKNDGLSDKITVHESLKDCVMNVDTICVATDWREFLEHDLAELQSLSGATLFVDCMNAFDQRAVKAAGFRYLGVGR